MRRTFHLYVLEILVVAVGLALVAGVYGVGKHWAKIRSDELAYLSIAVTGLLFVLGHVYSRLKDRRDAKRKRAQELFLEWHSKEFRESRIYVSRWIESNGISNIPALGLLEKQATEAYIAERVEAPNKTKATNHIHPLDDPEAKELHFFSIYQFFERWTALIDQDDIDVTLAEAYMTSYKQWYGTNFIERWYEEEPDQYIKASLGNIRIKVFHKSA